MILEYFDCDIPKTPSIKDLFEDIIKRQKQTDRKINFLAYHFAQDLGHLPPGFFTNDDEDTGE